MSVAPAGRTEAPPRRAKPAFGAIAVTGGVALVVGSFLQAASASARSGPFSVSVEKRYIDGDGPVTLIAGLAVIALGALFVARAVPRWLGWVIALFGAIGALVAAADIADVQDSIDQIEAIGGSASIGPALWVCLAGGIAAVVGGVLAVVVGSTTSSPPSS